MLRRMMEAIEDEAIEDMMELLEELDQDKINSTFGTLILKKEVLSNPKVLEYLLTNTDIHFDQEVVDQAVELAYIQDDMEIIGLLEAHIVD